MNRRYLPSLLLFIVINALAYYGVQWNEKDRIESVLNGRIEHLETAFKTILYEQRLSVDDFIHDQVKTNLDLLSKAVDASEQERNILRNELYKKINPIYNTLKKHGINQIQFVLPDNHSFLRLYKPEHYGDDLSDVRKTIVYVNATHKPIEGYEGGKVVHAYRYVEPIFNKKGRYIGAIEISFLTDYIQEYLTRISKMHTHLLIKKDVLSKQIWENTEFDPSFFQSVENSDYFLKITKHHNIDICITQRKQQFVPLRERISSGMALGKPFTIYMQSKPFQGELGSAVTDDDSVMEVLVFIPIKSIGQKGKAWLVSYEKDKYITATLKEGFIGYIIFFVLSGIVFYFIFRENRFNMKLLEINSQLAQTQKELEKSREVAHLGVWKLNVTTNQLSWSDEIFKIFELDKDKFHPSYEAFLEFIDPDDREMVVSAYENSLLTKEKYKIVHKLKMKDGRIKWVEEQCDTEYDLQGKPLISTGTVYDITEQKQAEALVQEKNREIETIFNLVPLPVCYINGKGEIYRRNVAFTDLFGYSEEETSDLKSWFPITFPDERYRREVIELWNTYLQQAKENNGSIKSDLYRITCKDGVLRTVLVGGKLLNDGYIATFIDITNEEAAKLALQKSQKYLQQLLNTIPYGVQVNDLSGVITYSNPAHCSLLGLEDGELAGYYIWDFQHGDTKEEMKKYLAYLVEHRPKPMPYISKNIKNGGKEMIFEVVWDYMYDETGALSGFISVISDVTERMRYETALKEAKAAAEAATKAKSEFLANMSHEIRTPLNGVIGLSKLLQKTELNAQQYEYLAKQLASSEALLHLINDILDFSKIEAGKLLLESTPYTIEGVLQVTRSMFEYTAHEKGIRFTVDIDENVPAVIVGDPLRTSQVFNNIVGNAIKFTESGSITIKVDAETVDDTHARLHCSVADTGIGISQEKVKMLFNAFTQSDSSDTRKYGGSGLGLTISKELIELMGGTIELQSTLGKGSTFSFDLLVGIGDKVDVSKELGKSLFDRTLRFKGDVLLVEDNEVNKMVIIEVFKDLGLNCDTAKNGLEAVEMAGGKEYDMIFMDLQMPVMDGFEATRRLRSAGKKLPIVALSAAVMQRDKENSKAVGMNAHLAKPLNEEELQSVLYKYLEHYHITEEESSKEESFKADAVLYGIDMEKFVSTVKNSVTRQNILNTFANTKGSFAQEIQQMDLMGEAFAKAVHALKGASGNIAATKLFEQCKAMEKSSTRDAKEAMLKEILSELNKIISGIKSSAKPQKIEVENVSKVEMVLIIEEWIEKLTKHSYMGDEAIDIFISQLHQYSEASELLRGMIDNIEFDKAIAMLKKIRRELV